MPVSGEQSPIIDAKGRRRGLKEWVICPICEVGRWVAMFARRKQAFSGLCKFCHNKVKENQWERHPRWNGGMTAGRDYDRTWSP